MRTLLLLAMLAAASMARPGRVHAQAADVIRGRVTDADAAPIQGVKVRATSHYGGVSKTQTTDKNGQFTIVFIDGEGDYWMDFSKIGFAPRRFEVKRIGTEEVLIANARMTSTIATLDPVNVSAQRQGQRAVPNRNAADRDISGAAAALSNDALSAADAGNLAAMAAGVAGIQLIPGLDGHPDMFSVLGLGGDQNATTINGLGAAISALPPDIIATATVSPYSFDPATGGFSGGQLAIKTQPGSNFSQRRMSHANVLPPLEWTDATGAAQSGKYTSVRLGGNAAGPMVLDQSFYNVAYNVSRQFSDAQTLFNTAPLGLSAAGVAADSVSRLARILASRGLPASLTGAPRLQAQNTVQGSMNLDLAPSSSGTGDSFTLGLLGSYQKREAAGGPSPLATPTHAGSGTWWTGSGVLSHSRYVGIGEVGILTRTNVGVTASSLENAPYLELPEGVVRVRSDLDDGTSPVASLAFGGGPARAATRSVTIQANNALNWFTADNAHAIKLTTSLSHATSTSDDRTGMLGTFTFNSLADLEAGRPSSFRRTLSPRGQSARALTAAASIGDLWRPRESLQIQYGLRVDGTRFLTRPELNTALADALGLRNDAAPSALALSPRAGLQWNYGAPPTIAARPGAARVPAAVVHVGGGLFQNVAGPRLLGGALGATGLSTGARSMACVGDATPIPDWEMFLERPDLVPAECGDGSSGTAFSTASPSVVLFDRAFREPRSLRVAADWSSPVLDNRFMVGVQTVITRSPNQTGVVDANFDPAVRFTLWDPLESTCRHASLSIL